MYKTYSPYILIDIAKDYAHVKLISLTKPCHHLIHPKTYTFFLAYSKINIITITLKIMLKYVDKIVKFILTKSICCNEVIGFHS